MMEIIRSDTRGRADHGWLDTRHTFSFAGYFDPNRMGFGPLRVLNEDRVAPGGGFPPHPHRDMEIVSIVLAGALAHRDSAGNGSVIRPGDVQRMSAGAGILHSEHNASDAEPVHFLQIWIVPEAPGGEPGYEQKRFEPETRRDRLALLAAKDGREGAVTLRQDVDLYGAELSPGAALSQPLAAGCRAFVQVTAGAVSVNGEALSAGDGAAIVDAPTLDLASTDGASLLVFDMA